MALGHETISLLRGDSDRIYPQFIGTNYSAVSIAAADGTTPKLLVTGAPGYVITNFGLQVDPICTIAAAGMVSLVFSDSSFGTWSLFRWYLPQTITPPTIGTNMRIVNSDGFQWNNKVANSSTSVSVNTTLTGTGTIRFFVRYALTSLLG